MVNPLWALLSFPRIEIFRVNIDYEIAFDRDWQYATPVLQWMTHFYSGQSMQKITSLTLFAFFTVEEDAIIQKFVGMRNETQVNVVLLALTLGPALSITVLTIMIALRLRLKYVYLPCLTGYENIGTQFPEQELE